MDDGTRALVTLSAALAGGGAEALDRAIDRADAEADGRAVEEALLQSYLFLGYPAALNAIARWRERTGRPAPDPTADAPDAWAERGAEVCGRVYGGQYDRLRANVARLHPDLERWMVVEGYGKVLARAGLELKVRELCIGALLAGRQAPRQLYAHLRGALQVGARPDEVEAMLDAAATVLPEERMQEARAVWSGVRTRRRRSGADEDSTKREADVR